MFERCLYFNLNSLTRKINKVWDEAFKSLDLSPSHVYFLRVVLEKPGISQQEIASELKLEKSTITRFAASLEKKGYLLRNKTGREQAVYPSVTAKSIQYQIERQCNELYQQMTENLGEKEIKELVSHLKETFKKVE